MKWVIDLLNAELKIPFISDLFEWITGSKLTQASVVCLVLAIPVIVTTAAQSRLSMTAPRPAPHGFSVSLA